MYSERVISGRESLKGDESVSGHHAENVSFVEKIQNSENQKSWSPKDISYGFSGMCDLSGRWLLGGDELFPGHPIKG
jgi:hypothetical protein